MSHLSRQSWELNHPLNGHPCPVTGLNAHVEDAWTYARGDEYRLRTGVLEPGVILSFPVGHTNVQDTHRFFANLKTISQSSYVDSKQFVLVEDYSCHTGSDYEGRITYMQRMSEEIKPLAIIFYTNSFQWRFSIRLGVALERWTVQVRIVDSYAQALQAAEEILARPLHFNASAKNNDQVPLQWNSPDFAIRGEVLPQGGLALAFKGRLHFSDMADAWRLYGEGLERCLAAKSGSLQVVYDLSEFQGISWSVLWGVFKYWEGFSGNRPIQSRIVVGTGFWPQFVFNYFQLIHRKGVYVAPNWAQAQERMGAYSKGESTVDEQHYDIQIEEALKVLDCLRWETPGLPLNNISIDDPEIQKFAYVISSLKQDLDVLFAVREKEMLQLEDANSRASQLSQEIEEALKRSEFERQQVQELMVENESISTEIQQSFKEVLHVLADFVDVRTGSQSGFTRLLAQRVRELGVLCQLPQDQLEELHDAVLLHHVGFLGIPDTVLPSDPEYQEHCEVGYRVLLNTKGELMKFGAEIAYSHHERWDGLGYPRGLAGEAIPLPARLVSLASEMLVFGTDDSLQMVTHMRGISGTILDPSLVEKIAVEPFNGEHI